MFKKTLLALAVIGMVSSPVLADLQPGTRATPRIGVVNVSRGVGPLGNVIYGPNPTANVNVSSSVTVTFGFFWPYGITVYAREIDYSFEWDSSEVSITGFKAVGLFAASGNFNSLTAPALFASPLPGTNRLAVFSQNVTPTATPQQRIIRNASVGTAVTANGMFTSFNPIFPFLQVKAHVNARAADGLPDLRVGIPSVVSNVTVNGAITTAPAFSSGLRWNYFAQTTVPVMHSSFSTNVGGTVNIMITTAAVNGYITAGGVFTFLGNYGVDVTPEPASATMLGLGILAVGGGIWRRRRRLNS